MPALSLTTYSRVSRRSYIGSEFEDESITNCFENKNLSTRGDGCISAISGVKVGHCSCCEASAS